MMKGAVLPQKTVFLSKSAPTIAQTMPSRYIPKTTRSSLPTKTAAAIAV